jgi:hypothetical protein
MKDSTINDRKVQAPGSRGRLTRKHRTTGLSPCSCGLLGCNPASPLPAKVRARRKAGKCMGCGNEKPACTCKRKGFSAEPYHFKTPEERAEEIRHKAWEANQKKFTAQRKAEMKKRPKK